MNLYTEPSELLFYFLYSVAFGFSAGLFYELFRLIRIALPHGKVIIFFEDFIFCFVSIMSFSVFVFSSATLCSAGTVRWFSVAGTLIGFAIYFFSLGRLIFAFSNLIIGFIRRIIGITVKILLYPLKKLRNRVILYINRLKAFIYRRRVQRQVKAEEKAIIRRARKGF